MAIKTDAMIAHNGADGYTIHIVYTPDDEKINVGVTFNNGASSEFDGYIEDSATLISLINRSITTIDNEYVSRVGWNAFANCSALRYAHFKNATEVRSTAFNGATALRQVILESVVEIATRAFAGCNALQYVYLGKNCTTIAATAFDGVTANVIIDCGFAATDPGAAGAPWGATNATINYDVTEPNPPALSILGMSPNPDLIQSIDLEPLEPEPVVEVKKTKRSMK